MRVGGAVKQCEGSASRAVAAGRSSLRSSCRAGRPAPPQDVLSLSGHRRVWSTFDPRRPRLTGVCRHTTCSTNSDRVEAVASEALPEVLVEDSELMAATVTAGALVVQRPLEPPTWIQKLEKLYSTRLDILPAMLGELNVATGFMIFFTGAVIKAAENALQALFQWLVLVVLPAFIILFLLRRWFFFRGLRFEEQPDGTVKKVAEPGAQITMRTNVLTLPPGVTDKDVEKVRKEGSNGDSILERAAAADQVQLVTVPGDPKLRKALFRRRYRSAWVDFHLALQLLLPGGMNGSYELLCMVPIMMFTRFLSRMDRTARFAARLVRWWTILFAPLALASMLFMTLQSLGTMFTLGPIYQQAGIVGVGLFVPFSLGTTYIVWIAPMVLIPGCWLRAWRNRIPKKPKTAEAIEAEKKRERETPKTTWLERIIWITVFLGALALAIGPLQGKWFADLPITMVFASQMYVGWRKRRHLRKQLEAEDGTDTGVEPKQVSSKEKEELAKSRPEESLKGKGSAEDGKP